jgi:hypothetical protein
VLRRHRRTTPSRPTRSRARRRIANTAPAGHYRRMQPGKRSRRAGPDQRIRRPAVLPPRALRVKARPACKLLPRDRPRRLLTLRKTESALVNAAPVRSPSTFRQRRVPTALERLAFNDVVRAGDVRERHNEKRTCFVFVTRPLRLSLCGACREVLPSRSKRSDARHGSLRLSNHGTVHGSQSRAE